MRKIALRWVAANCPNLHLQENFRKHLDQAVENDSHCYFCIGRKLTKRGKAYMLHWFAGELFVFELTPWQEESLRVAEGSWNTVFKEMPSVFNTKGLPVVSLENVSIDNAPSLEWGRRITGHISYETEAHCFFRHAVQLDYDFPDGPRGTAWSYPDSWFLTKGKLSFSFPPILDRDALCNIDAPQTVTLFLRLCTVPSPLDEDPGLRHSSFIHATQEASSSVHRLHNPPGNPYETAHPIVSNTRAILIQVDPGGK